MTIHFSSNTKDPGCIPNVGIIGGTGFYDLELLKNQTQTKVYTPFGEPSDLISIGDLEGKKIAFIPRHGSKHSIPPHLINYRANIWALKEIGVSRILALSTVGSLRDNLKPGDFVTPNQFIDFTRIRFTSFYARGQVCHISTADPFCDELRDLTAKLASSLGLHIHSKATYVCIEGPRFSTRAESKMFRDWGADIIGMTIVPECVLAREARICYVNLATVTDYDVWAERPVDAKTIVEVSRRNQDNLKELLKAIIPRILTERRCTCEEALKNAIY